MRHDPASGAIVIMLRELKMYGMAQAVAELTEQGAPAFKAAQTVLAQLLIFIERVCNGLPGPFEGQTRRLAVGWVIDGTAESVVHVICLDLATHEYGVGGGVLIESFGKLPLTSSMITHIL